MNRLLILITLFLTVMAGYGAVLPSDLDRAKAEDYLSGLPLTGPEGLWGFDPDEVTLMILRDDNLPGVYAIYVVDAVDCRLTPGMKIGELEASISGKDYRISIRDHRNKLLPKLPLEGLAKLDPKSGTMTIEGKSGKFSVTPSLILPNLLSLLRLRVRVNVNDPASKIPTGLQRLCPLSADHPNSPRYL